MQARPAHREVRGRRGRCLAAVPVGSGPPTSATPGPPPRRQGIRPVARSQRPKTGPEMSCITFHGASSCSTTSWMVITPGWSSRAAARASRIMRATSSALCYMTLAWSGTTSSSQRMADLWRPTGVLSGPRLPAAAPEARCPSMPTSVPAAPSTRLGRRTSDTASVQSQARDTASRRTVAAAVLAGQLPVSRFGTQQLVNHEDKLRREACGQGVGGVPSGRARIGWISVAMAGSTGMPSSRALNSATALSRSAALVRPPMTPLRIRTRLEARMGSAAVR